jgi:hypothetical protein
VIDAAVHAQSLEDRAELGDGLVGARHDLFGDGGALGIVAFEQHVARLALDHVRQLPRQIERALNGGVGAQAIGGWAPVRRVAHDEHAARAHARGVHVVDRPGAGRDQLDLKRGIADQLARDLRRQRGVHLGSGLGDVIAPDDQPFVPRPHHAHQPHAGAADVGFRLHHPVKHGRAMRDVTREIGAKQDVDRATDAHPALERQAGMFGDQRIAAVRAHRIFGAHCQFFA